MDDDQSMEEIRCDLDQPRIAPYKNTWRPRQNMVYWCNLMLAQKRGLQFYQTRSHAIVLYNTLPAICIEKAVCMKSELSGSCTTIGSRTKVGILGGPHPGLNSCDFLSSEMPFFSLAGKWIPLQLVQTLSTETPAARHTFTCTVTPQVTQHRWHVYICSRRVVRRKTSHHPRVMSLPLLHATLSTFSPSLSSASCVVVFFSNPDLLSTYPIIHCEDPRQDGTATEDHSSTGHEPKGIELNRMLVKPQNQIIDDQDDIEEIGVKKWSYSQSLVHSAYDSAESTATPPDSDLEDEQLRKMLASPL